MAALLNLLSFFPLLLLLLLLLLHLHLTSPASPSPPFSAGLQTLQNQIGYQFQSPDLLLQAMTHPSFSLDNNRALSLLGLTAIESAAALRLVAADPNASPAAIDARIANISSIGDCASAAKRLAIESLVRVAKKTSASSPGVLCAAYRAVFGAVAVDAGGLDAAAKALWRVLDGGVAAL